MNVSENLYLFQFLHVFMEADRLPLMPLILTSKGGFDLVL